MDAGFVEFGEVLGFGDARLGDEDGGVFDHVDEAQGVGDVGGHAFEVAVVDAQEGVARFGEADVRQDAEEVVRRMDLEQDGELELVGEDHEVEQFGLAQALGDEEDGVGPGGAALPDLVGVDDEVLAEDGEGHFVADAVDVFEFAGEEAFVGEAGDRRGPGVVILSGDGDGVKGIVILVFGPDPAGGGAFALDLGDDGGSGVFFAAGDSGEEVARASAFGSAFFECFEGLLVLAQANFFDLVVDNLAEGVWDGAGHEGEYRRDGGFGDGAGRRDCTGADARIGGAGH